MARGLRLQVPGGIYHVTTRGVARLPIFRNDDDRRCLLALLGDVVDRYEWSCHAYCLMTTHYHLLVRTPLPNLAIGMKRLNGLYAQGFNRRHGGKGHVFEARYHSVLIEREGHLVELCRYLALNPVRAGICDRPADWPWSSYRSVLGLDPVPRFLAAAWLASLFGMDEVKARRRLREFVEAERDV
jgi:REP element-mobilizing transposase RayT